MLVFHTWSLLRSAALILGPQELRTAHAVILSLETSAELDLLDRHGVVYIYAELSSRLHLAAAWRQPYRDGHDARDEVRW